jgi:hypothetical protein
MFSRLFNFRHDRIFPDQKDEDCSVGAFHFHCHQLRFALHSSCQRSSTAATIQSRGEM